jgi:carbamoyl-phosphate synthase large subunit
MKRILVTAAGGAPAINFVRSLRDGVDDYFILGVDANEYTLFRAETDVKELCPQAADPQYINYLNYLIEKYEIDFIHAQPDGEVGVLSDNRERLKCKTFLPSKESVTILRDKYSSYKVWHENGVPVPKTIILNSDNDLKKAYELFGSEIWIREIRGAAGKGSLSSPKFEDALNHINKNNGWGIYTAAEKLTKRTVTWMSIYCKGELIVAQTRERLYWEHGNRAQSGVTGITGTGRTMSDTQVDEIAIKSIFAVDKNPHGIFSVDMTYGQDGIPKCTEINIGKFFTTHYFFTQAGINFPEIFVKLAFDEEVVVGKVMNPLEDGLNWIRGMDTVPKLVKDEEIDAVKNKYKENLKALSHNEN